MWWFVSALPHVPTSLCYRLGLVDLVYVTAELQRGEDREIMGSVCAPVVGW